MHPRPTTPSDRRRLWFVLLAAVIARLVVIHFKIYAPDQSFTVDLAKLGWADMVRLTAKDTHPPLYYGLVKLWFLFTPDTMQWAQVFSVGLAAATLLVIFFFTREMFSPAAGWVALVFAAFMPYQVFWSHVARNHQLLSLAAALVIWMSYRWVDKPAHGRWLLMAACLALMINTNYFALIILPVWAVAFGVFERMPWRRRIELLAAPLPGLLIFLPWVPVVINQMHQRGNPMARDFMQEKVFSFLLFFHSIFGRMESYQTPLPPGLLLLLALIFTLILVAGFKSVGRRWSFWVLLIGMPTLPWAIAVLRHYSLAERHINFGVPLFMAYWGAAVVEAGVFVRQKLNSNREN